MFCVVHMESLELQSLILEIETQSRNCGGERPDWQQIWASIRFTGASFKEVRFESREERAILWDRYQRAIESVKALQQEEFRARERFKAISEEHLSRIYLLIKYAKKDDLLDGALLAFGSMGLSLLGKAISDSIFGELNNERDELRKRSDALKETNTYFSEHKSEMLGKHKREAFEYITPIREELQSDWNDWQSKMDEARENRRLEWEVRQAKREEWQEKHERWIENQNNFIETLEEQIVTLGDKLESRHENLSKLRDMYSNAKGSFEERVSGWIDECEEQISSIESKIEQKREKIDEVRAKIKE